MQHSAVKGGHVDKTTVLVIDDESEIREVIEVFLKNEGYQVLQAEDGLQGLQVLKQSKVDLVILDVMMPKLDGIQACIKARQTMQIPIIMLSAKNEDMDKIMGLTSGADDYVTKPFNPLELVARVKALLRRSKLLNQGMKENEIEIGDLVIVPDRHIVKLRDQEISLTPLEFKILVLLADHRGQVFSAQQIYESVWGEEALQSESTVMVHIRNIRDKIEDNPREPRYIKTVWGVGYKIG